MEKELLFSVTKKDLHITYFSGTGAGGQHRNKHQNCVRMRHPESGASSTGQANRERQANLKDAFITLVNTPEFKVWHLKKTHELLTGKSIEQKVAEAMLPKNMNIECKDEEGRWTPYIEAIEERE